MALIIRRAGNGWSGWLRCDVCGQAFGTISEIWIAAAPLDENIESRECVQGHRQCLLSACKRLFGVSKAVHWRGTGYFAKIFARPHADVLTRLATEAEPKWRHRGTSSEIQHPVLLWGQDRARLL
jgi:hypothetical protein